MYGKIDAIEVRGESAGPRHESSLTKSGMGRVGRATEQSSRRHCENISPWVAHEPRRRPLPHLLMVDTTCVETLRRAMVGPELAQDQPQACSLTLLYYSTSLYDHCTLSGDLNWKYGLNKTY